MPRISHYTPSQTDPQLLGAVTVGLARLRLLDDIVGRAEKALSSESRNHTLVVGPRGAGKTHLITVAHHRVGALQATGVAPTRAWLHEEGWMTLVSYGELLGEILTRSDRQILGGVSLGSTPDREAAIAAHAAQHGPIVVFVENLDQTLAAVGEEGQQRLRQFMENTRSLLFVATTTALNRELTGQDSPFYNFFTTTKLGPLGVVDARDMLDRLASLSSVADLEGLPTEVIDGRLRAVAHLAGGQPRMWSMFGQALTARKLDDLVPAFVELVDNLTPYYQQQLERLPAQQRRVVALLARADHPMSVKQIAEGLDMAEKSAAAALTPLRDGGWLHHTSSPFAAALDKRVRFHELSEPLVRLLFQSKEARSDAPIGAVVDFIKHWFEPTELADVPLADEIAIRYRDAASADFTADGTTATALQLSGLIESTGAPRVRLLGQIDEAVIAHLDGDAEPIMTLPTAVRLALEARVDGLSDARLDLHRWARAEYGDIPHADMNAWEERASDLVLRQENSDASVRNLARWQAAAWRFVEAESTLALVDESTV